MVDESVNGFDPHLKQHSKQELESPTDKRIFALASALNDNWSVELLYNLTKIDPWFLYKFKAIIDNLKQLETFRPNPNSITKEIILKSKRLGFSDKMIAECIGSSDVVIRKFRIKEDIKPFVKRVDTVSAEWPAITNYLYLTYNGITNDIEKSSDAVMVLGSGVYRIGSSVEFDCCAVGCVEQLRKVWMICICLSFI